MNCLTCPSQSQTPFDEGGVKVCKCTQTECLECSSDTKCDVCKTNFRVWEEYPDPSTSGCHPIATPCPTGFFFTDTTAQKKYPPGNSTL